MPVGRQFGVTVRRLYKLHNLPSRWHSTSIMVAPVSVDVLTEFSLPPVKENNENLARIAKKTIHFPNFESKEDASHSKEQRNETYKSFEERVTTLLSKNNLGEIDKLLKNAWRLSEDLLTKLFVSYSINGHTDKVETLQRISQVLDQTLHSNNGEFRHFLAKAHCIKGNSEKGLTILTAAYTDNIQLRSQYVTIFRDLIFDSVNNRSVASLMIFQNFVVRWSEELSEHYPLVCLWHQCWQSSWYSDQVLANELVDNHEALRCIIKDRITAFVTESLIRNNDDDATLRLLQTLLKYKFMEAYEQALRMLFEFRLKNRDMRGCLEILRNMKVLDLSLPQELQARYIHMVIDKDVKIPVKTQPSPTVKKFVFKF